MTEQVAVRTKAVYSGVSFAVWKVQGAWFWSLVRPCGEGGTIVAAGTEAASRFRDAWSQVPRFRSGLENGAIVGGRLIVPKPKTDAGTERVIPFTRRLCVTLSSWIARFPDVDPESYIFPHHRVASRGGLSRYHLYETDLRRPIGSWKWAWKYACRRAGVAYRWHDLRHTFVSRLAENPGVSEETIRALAGHVSKQMLQRYSHIRIHAKEAAILGLEGAEIEDSVREDTGERAQNWAQSPTNRLH